MLNAHSGDRLRSEDAVFLYLETPEAPLHIGSISIFDGKIPFQQCMEYIESRLPLIPRYRQRIVVPPFHFGNPTWEADPEFDIHNHVREVVMKSGTEDGLEGGRSALISRVHHCLVDGVSGLGLMNVMLDPSLRPRKPQIRNGRPAPLPG